MNSLTGKQASDTVVLHVDSRYRNKTRNPNSGQFSIDIEPVINNVASIRLTSIELPNVFYTFTEDKKNNAIYVDNQKIEIPDGNYTANKIICELQKVLDTTLGIGFDINFSDINGRVTIKSSTNTPFRLKSSLFDSEQNPNRSLAYNEGSVIPVPTLLYSLGFRKDSYSGRSEYTSESLIDVVGPNYLIMRVNDFGSMRYRQYRNSNSFAKIILCAPKTAVSFDTGSIFHSKQHDFTQPVNLSKLNIELIDPYENIVDMVFMDYSMTFEIEVIRDSYLKKRFENDRFQNYPI